jgi:hypothetical protein
MRDDLHKTPTLRSHWKRTVLIATRLADRDTLPNEIVSTVDRDFNSAIRADWLARLVKGIDECANFLEGMSDPRAVVNECEKSASHTMEFELCETMRYLSTESGIATLVADSVVAVKRRHADAGVEHCWLSVALEHGEGQGVPLRRVLSSALASAVFSFSVSAPRRHMRDEGMSLLDRPLALSL